MKSLPITEQKWFIEFKKKVESMPGVITELPDKSLRRLERERGLKQ